MAGALHLAGAMATRAALLVLLWLGFAEASEPAELLACAVTTGLVLIAYGVTRRCTGAPRTRSGAAWAWAWQAFLTWPRTILSDSLQTFRAVTSARDQAGAFRRIHMPARDGARAAWSMVGTSIAPNAYLVRIDLERLETVIHELVPSTKPDDEVLWWPR